MQEFNVLKATNTKIYNEVLLQFDLNLNNTKFANNQIITYDFLRLRMLLLIIIKTLHKLQLI